MAQAKLGDTVRINYTGKLADGTIFDTSRNRHPLQFTLGKGQVIAGFEQAVVGMSTGETKTATIPVDRAYGPRRDDLVVTVNRSQIPTDFDPQIGQRLEITQADDRALLVTVTGATETTLTLDSNHPLAGKELIFEIELVAIA